MLTALLAAPGLAAHDAPGRTPGPPGAVYGGRTSQAHPMSLGVTRDGTGLRDLFTRIDAGPCSDARTFNVGFDLNRALHILIARGGAFAATMPVKVPASSGEQLDLQLQFKGKIGRTRAFGTMRLAGAIRDASGNETDRCDSGLFRWSLRRGPTYGGRLITASRGTLVIRLDSQGKEIRSFLLDFPILCGSVTFHFTLEHLNIPVGRNGAFSKRGVSGVRLKGPEGSTVSGRYALRGDVGPRRASGTYRAFGSVRFRDGSMARCDSSTIPWIAARG